MNKFLILFIASSFFSSTYAQTSLEKLDQINNKELLQGLPKNALLTDDEILPLAKKQVLAVYTFYFEDIETWKNKIKHHFSSEGYQNFMDLMKQSIDSVARDKLIVQPKIEGQPILVSKGGKKGLMIEIQTWHVEVPLQITYLGPHSKTKQDLVLALEVQNKPASTDEILIQSLKIKSP